MTNTAVDLDGLLATGDSREIFEPVNAWSGASGRIYVSTHRASSTGAIQLGYDPENDKTFARANSGAEGSVWGTWTAIEAPPPPPEARKTKAKADDEKK